MSFRSRFPSEVFYSVPRAEVTQGPKDYYPALFRLSEIALRNTYDISIHNPERILDEPAVYAANHVQFADSLLVSMIHTETTHHPMRFVIKKELSDGRGLDNEGKYGKPLQWFMGHTRQIPVDREGLDGGASTIAMSRLAREALRRGESIGIHPGRTRSDESDGLPLFEAGVGAIALSNKVPVVPVAIQYGEKSGGVGRRTSVDVSYGVPITPSDFPQLPPTTAEEFANNDATTDSSDGSKPKRLSGTEKAMRIASEAERRVATMLNVQRTGLRAALRGKSR